MIHPRTLEPIGLVFPPRDEWDIAAYDSPDMVVGYMDQTPGGPSPGDNRSPGYRWGWANRARDRQADDDGFDTIRRAYLAMKRSGH